MRVVIMDTRHHRTLELPHVGFCIVQPTELALVDQAHFKRYGFEEVVFTATGSLLYGDPIFYQTTGPTLPFWWWGCKCE